MLGFPRTYSALWISVYLSEALVKNPPANAEDLREAGSIHRGFGSWVGKILWEEDRATHSSILAWRISWTEEPGGLQSMGSWRVRHDWSDSAHTRDTVTLNQAWEIIMMFLDADYSLATLPVKWRIHFRGTLFPINELFTYLFTYKCKVIFYKYYWIPTLGLQGDPASPS